MLGKLLTDPVGLAIQKFGGSYLARATMSPGQLEFLAPILRGDDEQLRDMRQALLDIKTRNGGHVHIARWDHPPDMAELEAQGGTAGASAGDGAAAAAGAGGAAETRTRASGQPPAAPRRTRSYTGLPADLEGYFLSLLPRFLFAEVKGQEGWEEWSWHAEASGGTVIDHMAGHGQGKMFRNPVRRQEVLDRAWSAVEFRQARRHTDDSLAETASRNDVVER